MLTTMTPLFYDRIL